MRNCKEGRWGFAVDWHNTGIFRPRSNFGRAHTYMYIFLFRCLPPAPHDPPFAVESRGWRLEKTL